VAAAAVSVRAVFMVMSPRAGPVDSGPIGR
jgi:hypothetical protein